MLSRGAEGVYEPDTVRDEWAAENNCASATFFLTSNKALTKLAEKLSRGVKLTQQQGCRMVVLLEDEREHVAQMVQGTLDSQSGVVSISRAVC